MRKICLIACASQKQSVAVPAHDLYQSDLYKKSVAWMKRHNFDDWFILSAKHGLVKPDTILSPYDLTLNTLGTSARRQWAKSVLTQLQDYISEPVTITFLAGLKYRDFLVRPLQDAGHNIIIPMEGLRIGEQLQWLDKH